MAFYVFTGKLGGGKNLCAVGRIKEKLEKGCTVATNIDLNLHKMFNAKAKKIRVLRLPDKPTLHSLQTLNNLGNSSYDETRNGLIVLDECGTWFNSRNWSDKTRKPINDWFLHSRKLGWDVILIIQDVEILDSQARLTLAEHTAFCRRLDRVQIPFLGPIFKLITGKRLGGPKIFVVKVVYGISNRDLVADRYKYFGRDLFKVYDTKQCYLDSYDSGIYSVLPPFYTSNRYRIKWSRENIMKLAKIYHKWFKPQIYLGVGAACGVFLSLLILPYINDYIHPEPAPALVSEPKPAVVPKIETKPVEADTQTPIEVEQIDLREMFANYSILGFMTSKFKDDVFIVGDGSGATFTDSQIRSMGYLVTNGDECSIQVTDPRNKANRAYILATNCIPRIKEDLVNL